MISINKRISHPLTSISAATTPLTIARTTAQRRPDAIEDGFSSCSGACAVCSNEAAGYRPHSKALQRDEIWHPVRALLCCKESFSFNPLFTGQSKMSSVKVYWKYLQGTSTTLAIPTIHGALFPTALSILDSAHPARLANAQRASSPSRTALVILATSDLLCPLFTSATCDLPWPSSSRFARNARACS